MKDPIPNPSIDQESPIDIYESHKNLFERYAGSDIHVELAPPGLDTFAFDLEKNTIYLSPRFYKDRFTSYQSADFTVFAILHEIGHFREKLEMLEGVNGMQDFQKYLDRIKKDKAFSLTDNLIADISINREVIARTNTEYKKREQDLYTKDLFPIVDFTDVPRHIQFGQAILREHRVLGEPCLVDPEVRFEIDNLHHHEKGDIVDIMTNPDITMSTRLKILDKFIMPIVERLKQKDIEDKKEQQKKQKQDKKNEDNDGDNKELGDGNSENDIGESDTADDIFKEDYEKAEKGMMSSKPAADKEGESDIDKAFEKAFKDYLDKHPKAKSLDKQKTPAEIKKELEEQEAKDLDVDVNDLRAYDNIKDRLESIVDTENNKSVIEQLSELFRRIISKRKKDRMVSKAPVAEGA